MQNFGRFNISGMKSTTDIAKILSCENFLLFSISPVQCSTHLTPSTAVKLRQQQQALQKRQQQQAVNPKVPHPPSPKQASSPTLKHPQHRQAPFQGSPPQAHPHHYCPPVQPYQRHPSQIPAHHPPPQIHAQPFQHHLPASNYSGTYPHYPTQPHQPGHVHTIPVRRRTGSRSPSPVHSGKQQWPSDVRRRSREDSGSDDMPCGESLGFVPISNPPYEQ